MKNLGTKRLETERLILRKINENVTKALFDFWIQEYQSDDTYRWIIELKESQEVIGTIEVSKQYLAFSTCELTYCIGEKYFNKE